MGPMDSKGVAWPGVDGCAAELGEEWWNIYLLTTGTLAVAAECRNICVCWDADADAVCCW